MEYTVFFGRKSNNNKEYISLDHSTMLCGINRGTSRDHEVRMALFPQREKMERKGENGDRFIFYFIFYLFSSVWRSDFGKERQRCTPFRRVVP
jgi:hypothetical protein